MATHNKKHTSKFMLMEECGRCKYLIRLIGLGKRVRCSHPDNQKYRLKDDNATFSVIITRVLQNSLFKETGQKGKK